MRHYKEFFLVINIIVLCCLEADGASKYYDGENKPYEFGFNIEGEQHRHEKKDENGIIMGEFGFITADGVYHVTVYATDENGNFKIVSMKNIRVKPYPSNGNAKKGASPERKGNSLPLPPAPPQAVRPDTRVEPPKQQTQKPSIFSPAKSCSHCSLPSTTTQAPKNVPAPNYNTAGQNAQNQPNYGGQNTPNRPSTTFQAPHTPINQPSLNNQPATGVFPPSQSNNAVPKSSESTNPQSNRPSSSVQPSGSPLRPSSQEGSGVGTFGSKPYSSPQDGSIGTNFPQTVSQSQPNALLPGSASGNRLPGNSPGNRNPKQFDSSQNTLPGGDQPYNPQGGFGGTLQSPLTSDKPTLVSANMQRVDKNTDVNRRGPGEKEGLPDKLNKNDMMVLLYTFNYTLGFHAHHEEGYTNGAKKGYYYVTGRNGIRTRVDYVADETGFHPKITQEVFDVLSEEVPKPETEKDEKYGLKGYEFKWLYYPADS